MFRKDLSVDMKKRIYWHRNCIFVFYSGVGCLNKIVAWKPWGVQVLTEYRQSRATPVYGGKYMSRNYSPKNFIQKTPNSLLKQFFEREEISLELDWDNLGEPDVQSIYGAIERLPEKNRTKIENIFRQINEMACDKGTQSLIEEGESMFHNLQLADRFEAMSNHYEIAFWMYLNHPLVFDIAESLYRMDNVGSWKQCAVYRGLEPKIEPEEINQFAEKIIEFYKKQGRGHHCVVRNYKRENPERHCYFAYPEDYAKTELEYDEDGKLDNRNIKPAFEVIFVYHTESGILETNAKGKTSDVKKLQVSFCQTILGLEKIPDGNSKEIKLEKLKENFGFPVNPTDGIKRVQLKMLQLELPNGKRRRLTFEDGSSDSGQPIYNLIENALNQENIPLSEVKAVKAKIQFEFDGINGKKGKTVTFDIATPDHCTLKDDPLHQIAKKYLEEWGLVERAELPPITEDDNTAVNDENEAA